MMMKNYMKHVYRRFLPWHSQFPIILLKLAVTVFTSLFSDIVTEFT